MSRVVSVITPVHGPSAQYLADAYKSLVRQDMPDGWTWEWIIQEDGRGEEIPAVVPNDARIRFGGGRSGGPGVARTLALSRASGGLIKVLDADDALTEGALARDIAILAARDDVGWTTSSVLDYLPDGRQISWEHADPPEGIIARGEVLRYWEGNGYRLPVHPATLCLRREIVFALGGWMALPASEDTGLLVAANIISSGYFIGAPGLLYRKWPGQVTSQPAHTDEEEQSARISIIAERARALLSLLPIE